MPRRSKNDLAFGAALEEQLARHSLRQSDLAKAVGVSRAYVNQLANGVAKPSPQWAGAVADDGRGSAARRGWGEGVKFRFKGHAEMPFWRWVCGWTRAGRDSREQRHRPGGCRGVQSVPDPDDHAGTGRHQPRRGNAQGHAGAGEGPPAQPQPGRLR